MLRLAVSNTSNIKVKGQKTMGGRMMEGDDVVVWSGHTLIRLD